MYYTVGWLHIKMIPFETTGMPSTIISVIIPARNEEKNIAACIQSLADQSYPPTLFEIIVVDDFSEDRTAQITRSLDCENIKLISLKDLVLHPINSYKKKAIEMAIEKASGELIITTDADCIAPKKWLSTIAAYYEKTHAKFIAMPVLLTGGNKFIEIFQSLDFMVLQGITGASVTKNFHAMCNGANLAYTKKAFHSVNGFSGIDSIASGDDMLLMHKISKAFPGEIHFLKDKNVIVQTAPEHSLSSFFNQRIRWASKSGSYNDKSITGVLVTVYLCNLLLLAIPFVALISNQKFPFVHCPVSLLVFWLWLILFKTLIELVFLVPVSGFFNKQHILIWFPVMQPFHILYTVIAGFLGMFGKYTWKGREVK
jgi:cellulose synthase/poly-beta-1,6-N-acetylglucosamine synthase-like glycosyltransferase